MEDKIVKSVVDKFTQRSETGIKKYGTTLERNDLSLHDWLTHLQDELMDATLYVEKLKSDINNLKLIDKYLWDSADKITHEGYVYVRYKDVPF